MAILSIPGGAVKMPHVEECSEGILHEVSVGADDRGFANGDDEERASCDGRKVPVMWDPYVSLGERLVGGHSR